MSRTKEQSQTSATVDDIAQQAKTAFQQVKTEAMETGKAALDDIKTRAADVAETMKDGLESRADVAKDGLADGAQRLAESLRSAGGEPGSLQAKVLDLVATNVVEMSEQLRGRDLRSLLDDAQGFARRNPALFVAGAAVAGFAVARFLRASAKPDGHDGEVDLYAANMASGMDDASYGGAYTGDGMTGSMATGSLGGMSGEGFDAGASGSMGDDAMTGFGSTTDEDARLRDGLTDVPGPNAGSRETQP